ncbi:hypothetical protein FQN50_002318 [Emmonsiellopsis sp. PD_5]|nr:hypothetical protein FQN50_002318 [Emmonsiellopsis sp. PD_5]
MVLSKMPVRQQHAPDSPGTIDDYPSSAEPDSIDVLSRPMKTLIKKIQNLRHLGIENEIPLPKICVVGDQSAGKSSLIEGMSEIKVPRSAGCCTRCPLEINLSDSDSPDAPWSCKVFLVKKYMYDTTARRGRGKGLGPWIDQEPEIIPFATLTEKDQIQEAIKWAQLATLNPSSCYEEYIPGQNEDTDASHFQVKFSPNVVRLDISAPRFRNLSFYDLPGVINVAEVEEEKYLVGLVENLVKQYISTPSCIVLLTMPMTDDATNSSAARIIREVKATSRTLGVLTKPDRIVDAEGYEQWREILRGEKFTVGHEYYVIRNNPNPSIEHSIAREEEEEFFSVGPWVHELSEFSGRFGTCNLQAVLSKLLMAEIQHCLPGIIEQINLKTKQVDEELLTLPDPPFANIQFILCDKLHEFDKRIHAQLSSGPSGSSLQKSWMKIATDFQRSLFHTRPTMRLSAVVEKFLPRKPAPFSFDDDCEITETRPSPKRRGTVDPETPIKRQKVQSPAPQPVPRMSQVKYLTEHFKSFKSSVRVFTLDDIREESTELYTAGVPGLASPLAVEKLNKDCVKHWNEPMKQFLIVTYGLMESFLMEQLDAVFSAYQRTKVYGELKEIILDFLEKLKEPHFHMANETYEVECQKPFTMATDMFNRAQKEALDTLKSIRHNSRVTRYLEQEDVYKNGRRVEPSKITEAEMGEDEFSREIEIMAASRAYYEIASARFGDTICQSVHTKLFSKCYDELRQIMIMKLGILDNNASERCMELMVEDPERQIRRRELKKKQEQLQKAMDSLCPAMEDMQMMDMDMGNGV